MQLPDFLLTYQTRVNTALDACLPLAATEPALLHQAMRYSVLGGGKRLRAMLVYAAGELFAADAEVLDTAASVVELIHAYSLVHDDLPAMDNDDLRHGHPTCHLVYGDAIAILVGDALQSLAFELLARPHAAVLPAQQLAMLVTLAQAVGSLGMVGGQVMDLAGAAKTLPADQPSLQKEEHSPAMQTLDTSHQKKTAALLVASVSLGALAGNCQDIAQLQALQNYASHLGLAFQICDDILDVEASTAVLGKTQGADSARHKASYPAVFGLAASKQRALQLYHNALQCLAQAGIDSLALQTLAEFVVKRGY